MPRQHIGFEESFGIYGIEDVCHLRAVLVKRPGNTVFIIRVPTEQRKQSLAERCRGDVLGDEFAPFGFGAYNTLTIAFIGGSDCEFPCNRVYEQFYGILFPKLPYQGFREFDLLMREGYGRFLLRVKKLCAGNLKATHIEVTRFHLYLYLFRHGHLRFSFFLDFGVHTSCRLEVVLFSECRPPGVDDNKALKDTAVKHSKLRQIGLVFKPGIVEHSLYRYKVIPRHYGVVMVVIVALRTIPSVLHRLVCTEVWGERLSCDDVTAMPFITQDLNHAARSPFDIAKIGLPSKSNKSICDLLRRVSVKVHKENELDGRCFLRVDDKLSVCIVLEAEELRCQRNAVVKAHTQRCFHTTASCMGLFLCHRRNEGKSHRRVIVQGEDALRLKEHTNRVLQFRKFTHNADTYQDVSCQTGNALRNDEVDLSGSAIRKHLHTLCAVLKHRSADTLICVNLDECPMGVVFDEILVVSLLKLIGGGLPYVIGGYTNINRNTHRRIIIVIVNPLLFRYVLIILRVDLRMHSLSCTLTVLFFLRSFIRVYHVTPPLSLPRYREATANRV